MAEVGLLAPDARVELIEGEIIDIAPIGSRHAGAVDRLAQMLIRAVGERAIVGVQRPIRLGTQSEPQPDLALLRPHPDFYSEAHPTAADILLLIEVSDTTWRYDREIKLSLYARHGIPEVWIANVDRKELHCFRNLQGGTYFSGTLLQADEVGFLSVIGMTLDLSGLF